MKNFRFFLAAALCAVTAVPVAAQVSWDRSSGKMPPALYEEWRSKPFPADGVKILTNPTALQWGSERYWNGRDVRYNVYLSQDEAFPAAATRTSLGQRFCFYNPHRKLEPGKWFWKYEIVDKDKVTACGPYMFVVTPQARVFETPDFAQLTARVPASHPRVMNQGNDIRQIREKAPFHPLYEEIVLLGRKALEKEIYRGPIDDPDQARAKALTAVTGGELKNYFALLDAYVLTGDKAMLQALTDRIAVLLTWPTNDLLGSQVLTALSMGYDIMYDTLDEKVKEQMLAVIDNQIKHGLSAWPGRIEGRQVENHFWQMEIGGNFNAALATLGVLDSSREMLEYTYGLFVARFPNLATQEGGWAEGMGYFGVNKSAIVDMALILKKVAGADVFAMQWYENLPDYYMYFAPAGGQIAGFGDMHDRVSNGNIGQSMMLVVGVENQDQKALFRLSQTLTPSDYMGGALKRYERWYQVVNDITLPEAKKPEGKMPLSKVFYGVGLAAMHTNLLDQKNNTAVYFRSSPFGAKGHMHANQNCFNIARKGERIFYSTGYYTTFADPHSLTSYRATRAHNGILVDGCGQAFGHEGYGWIKRFIDGGQMTYVCGDATMAYRPTVDKQFLGLNEEYGVKNTAEDGFGDAQLKLYERHMVFLRPDIVVVYDVLESERACSWTWLIHSMKESVIGDDGTLSLEAGKSSARVQVMGSVPLKGAVTDKFYSPAIDYKKKYKATPDQWHVSYTSQSKTPSMRFLSFIRLSDKGQTPLEVEKTAGGYKIGEYTVKAELDTAKPAVMTVSGGQGTLYVNTDAKGAAGQYSVLVGKDKKTVRCENLLPF